MLLCFKKLHVLFIFLFSFSILLAEQKTEVYQVGNYQISELKLLPDPPEVGDQVVQFKLKDSKGMPIKNAIVEVEAFMPAMGAMSRMSSKNMADLNEQGIYEVELEVSMGGSWELPIRVKIPAEKEYMEFPFNITIDVDGFIYKGRKGTRDKNSPKQKSKNKSIYISDARQQLIGVELGKAEIKHIQKEIKATARVDYDESKLVNITLKYSGYIEKLFVDKTGAKVKKGEVLFSIYSPELYAAKLEYQQLYKQSLQDPSSKVLVQLTEQKLKLWDLNSKQIRRLRTQKRLSKSHTIYSPIAGFILQKNILEGSYIMKGKSIYQIVDLSTVWALIEVYEFEAAEVKIKDKVMIHFSNRTDSTILGTVDYIYPTLNSKTRTIKLRVELENRDLSLKPGMYAYTSISVNHGEKLVVPRRAVMFSGNHQYVFLADGEGYFEPQEVEIGIESEFFLEITSGLKEGDQISFSGNFLISSEASLRNALPKWSKK